MTDEYLERIAIAVEQIRDALLPLAAKAEKFMNPALKVKTLLGKKNSDG